MEYLRTKYFHRCVAGGDWKTPPEVSCDGLAEGFDRKHTHRVIEGGEGNRASNRCQSIANLVTIDKAKKRINRLRLVTIVENTRSPIAIVKPRGRIPSANSVTVPNTELLAAAEVRGPYNRRYFDSGGVPPLLINSSNLSPPAITALNGCPPVSQRPHAGHPPASHRLPAAISTAARRPPTGRPSAARRYLNGRPPTTHRLSAGISTAARRPPTGLPSAARRYLNGRTPATHRPPIGCPPVSQRTPAGHPSAARRPPTGRPSATHRSPLGCPPVSQRTPTGQPLDVRQSSVLPPRHHHLPGIHRPSSQDLPINNISR
nr:early nodulin-75-like [Aedes albopictus]